ncbi:hypothetical protein QFC19_003679 [Naganishia cerealis]|uniref:Uncharacterized protein n=1 Tax=Naganishia cerealis TaxID=610337 RepID=A0ACC2W324_9TREE|nr:hypothetical protein QFC19_003679 [Naganishia cerealis]
MTSFAFDMGQDDNKGDETVFAIGHADDYASPDVHRVTAMIAGTLMLADFHEHGKQFCVHGYHDVPPPPVPVSADTDPLEGISDDAPPVEVRCRRHEATMQADLARREVDWREMLQRMEAAAGGSSVHAPGLRAGAVASRKKSTMQ